MMDASVLFSPATPINDLGKPQNLPAPSMQDVMRFENILNQGASSQADIATSQTDSGNLLQLADPANTETTDFKQAAIKTVESMDNSYHSMLDQFGNMPSFQNYMAEKGTSINPPTMRTYPEVANHQGTPLTQTQQAVQDTQNYMTAALEYNGLLTRWSMNAGVWMSKFSLISSAVNQVSHGFKTLFQTG